jgi:glycerol-3-phosphate cytidylyltransferase
MPTSIIELFDLNLSNKYYLESVGFNTSVPVYTDFNHLNAKIFFKILDSLHIDYYVFAGTSVGYVRNKKNIPWADDYDIIIFEDEIEKFENIIVPKLQYYGYNCFKPCKQLVGNAGFFCLSMFGQKCFQCDIFYTKIINGVIKNTGLWGLYNCKNIPVDIVKPKQYLTIDNDLTLPFFNNVEKDVQLEYGDVYNTCVVQLNHCETCIINKKFNEVYDDFNLIKQTIINNTIQLFNKPEYVNNLTLENYDNFFCSTNIQSNNAFETTLAFLKYINANKIKNLYIMDAKFLLYCVDLKFYFKDINIYFYALNAFDNKHIILLNYVDKIFCSKQEYIKHIEDAHLLFLNKPKIELIKVITFGTYDLFHIGHTNILKRASDYGELIVGVSTDELNEIKGKYSINKLEQRISDIYNTNYATIVFHEESLELKNEYVQKYNCNLLIMGDDWKDSFNFCDCACLYLPRTPNVSTTILKETMLK